MKPKDQRTILVDEEPAVSFRQAKSFLEENNYEIKAYSKNSDTDYSLEAHSKEKRFWKLAFSNKLQPQILKISFKKSLEKTDHTEIQTIYEYFDSFVPSVYFLDLTPYAGQLLR